MVVDSCCLCLSFSRCSRYLVAGDVKGSITVWDIATGKRLDSFVGAHSKGVTSVEFNQDSSLVLSTSFDYSITAHGRKSGALLKSFRGHTSYCNRAKFSEDNTKIISGSSDGTVKIWNYATTECLKTLAFQDGKIILQAFNAPAIHSLLSVPGLDNHFVIISNSRHAYMVNMDGAVLIFNLDCYGLQYH